MEKKIEDLSVEKLANQLAEEFINKTHSKINDEIERLRASLSELVDNEKAEILAKLRLIIGKMLKIEIQDKKLLQILSQKKILLDVGGTYFATTLTTLTKYKNSKLAKIFSGDFELEYDADGRFFIDRNGEHFKYILDSLRNDELILPQNEELRDKVINEFKFFNLEDLLPKVPTFFFDPDFCGMDLRFSNQNMTVEKINCTGYSSVLGNLEMKQGIYSWDVFIDNISNSQNFFDANSGGMSIGVSDKNEISKNDMNNLNRSWCITSQNQKYRLKGNFSGFLPGQSYNIEVNFDQDKLTIKGSNTNIDNSLSFRGKSLYLFCCLYSVGNKLTIKNFKKIK